MGNNNQKQSEMQDDQNDINEENPVEENFVDSPRQQKARHDEEKNQFYKMEADDDSESSTPQVTLPD